MNHVEVNIKYTCGGGGEVKKKNGQRIAFYSLTLNIWHVHTCKINVTSIINHLTVDQSLQVTAKYFGLH